MPETKPYTVRKEYPRPIVEDYGNERDRAVGETLEALNTLLAMGQKGDKITVEMGTGGRVHVKTYRRGF